MPTLELPVRYFQDSTPDGVACREENFITRELIFPLPVEQTAHVLIDLWNDHHIESWLERAAAMTRDVIVPLIDRARDAGLAIVHAPAPQIAEKYDVYQGRAHPSQPGPAVTWPPAEFRARSGEYQIGRGPRDQEPGIESRWEDIELDISPSVTIRESDFLIATGQQLHDLCEEREILHLLIAGFATNWCIMGRDYGVRAMSGRGYNTILIRDATEGVEFPDTLERRWATELSIREAEQVWGFTTGTADIYEAIDAPA